MPRLRLVPMLALTVVLACDDDSSPGDTGDLGDAAQDAPAEVPGDASEGDGEADSSNDGDADVADADDAPTVDGPVADVDAASDASSEDASDAGVDAPTEDAVDASDASGGADAFPEPPDCEGEQQLIVREADEEGISFRLDRCMPQICGGGCPVFQPQLTIAADGRIDIATTADIAYTQTHHNWNDSLIGTLDGRRLVWSVEFTFEGGLVEHHTIAIETLAGAPILEETTFPISPF